MACSPCGPGFGDEASRAENAHCPRGTFCINVHFLMQPIRYKRRNLPNDGSRMATRWSKFRLPMWSNMILVSWMVAMTTMTYNNNTDRELEGCAHSFSSVWNKIKKCNIGWQHDQLLEQELDADDCMWAVREQNVSQGLLRMPTDGKFPMQIILLVIILWPNSLGNDGWRDRRQPQRQHLLLYMSARCDLRVCVNR